MKRIAYLHLIDWKTDPLRKPLIVRGARQVGKTYVVRQLGELFESFVEVDFERNPEASMIFERDLDPVRIIRDLSLLLDKKIIPGKTLIFFDEIQQAPNVIKSLRYFFEDLPELHVVAAGSLIDFALESIGIPVGRVSFLNLFPLSFIEFLLAKKANDIVEFILDNPVEQSATNVIHSKIINLLGEYMLVGGMPEALNVWLGTNDFNKTAAVHSHLLDSYKQDFEKYAKSVQVKYVELLFKQVPFQLAKKFKYSQIEGGLRKRELAPCLDLLQKAGVMHKIYHSDGQGIPLGAQASLETFKVVFMDVALNQALLGLKIKEWLLNAKSTFVNQGALVESFVAQEILAYSDPSLTQELYYWQRQTRGAQAEIDFLTQIEQDIIPIEVKSGKGTSLKSIRVFLTEHKNSPYGIRFSTHNYSDYDNIHSYPLYAISKVFLGHKRSLKPLYDD